jgi:hypothetical protein
LSKVLFCNFSQRIIWLWKRAPSYPTSLSQYHSFLVENFKAAPMTRTTQTLAGFVGAFVTVGAIAFWLFHLSIGSLFSIRGAVILCFVLLVASLSTSTRDGTNVRLPFRLLAGILALASFAALTYFIHLYFSVEPVYNEFLLIAFVVALFGASFGYAAIKGRSPFVLFRKK